MHTDPVCFMDVEEQLAISQGLTSEQHGQTYYFCSQECKRQFDHDPANYIGQPTDWESPDMDTGEDVAR